MADSLSEGEEEDDAVGMKMSEWGNWFIGLSCLLDCCEWSIQFS